MDTDTASMQKAAEERVKRMQERSQRLLANGPTFGTAATAPPKEEKPLLDDRWLILLLLLMLSQNGGSKSLLLLLAYLSL